MIADYQKPSTQAPTLAESAERKAEDLSRVGAIVLAGTHDWEGQTFDQAVWRPLVPVLSRPLLWHILEWLGNSGIRRAQVCANSCTHILRRDLGTNGPHGVNLEYYEDVMPRGPAGCLRDAAATMSTEELIVIEGSLLSCLDLQDLLKAHRFSGAAATVVVLRRDNGQEETALEPAGIYIFDRRVLAEVPELGYQDIKESLIPKLHAAGVDIARYDVPESMVPRVRTWDSYLKANTWALGKLIAQSAVPQDYRRVDEALIHDSARIGRSVRLFGPIMIGPQTVLEENALVIGPATIGANCVIHHNAVVSNCAIWDHCIVGSTAVLDQAVLTHQARIEDHTVVRRTVCMPAKQLAAGSR